MTTRRDFLKLLAFGVPAAGVALGAASIGGVGSQVVERDVDLAYFDSEPLEFVVDRRKLANELADNIKLFAYEMGNDPLQVVDGLLIDRGAFAADLGCSVAELGPRLAWVE